jgi:hypothetical protein
MEERNAETLHPEIEDLRWRTDRVSAAHSRQRRGHIGLEAHAAELRAP